MEYARSLGLVNNVWSSGLTLRDPDVAPKVTKTTEGGFVSVHLDSLSTDTYARLHPKSDTANVAAIIEGVDRVQRAGKAPDQMINCITYTALQPAEDAVAAMDWWWREKGMRTCLTMFNPAGMGEGWSRFVPSTDATRVVFAARDRLNYGANDGSIAAMDTDKFYCGTMATVTFAGDVTPCSVIREGVANIRTTPFEQIVRDHLAALVHAPLHESRRVPAPCDRCEENSHCWGCRASAHHYGGDADGVDPKCWRLPVVSKIAVAALRPTGRGDAS
jgi:radical SAM protein with 4Fe4S-binding SPASM domain